MNKEILVIHETLLDLSKRINDLEESYSGQFIEISNIEDKIEQSKKEFKEFEKWIDAYRKGRVQYDNEIEKKIRILESEMQRINIAQQIMSLPASKKNKANTLFDGRPEFSREQEDWICYMIGEWYLAWKARICHKDGTHNLGRAKEMLKALLCADHEYFCAEFSLMMINLREEAKDE